MKALMRPAFTKYILVVLSVLATQFNFAKEKEEKHADDGGIVDSQEEISEYILHHIKDAHDFHLFSYTNGDGERKHIGFPLPVIVYTSEGLRAFMSSEFHHDDSGHHIVEADGVQLVKYHEKIYELNAGAHAVKFDHETHKPTNAASVLDLSITKSVFGILLVGVLMLLAFGGLAKQYKNDQIPTGFARFLEPLVIYVRDEIARPNIGEKKYKRFTGYLLTVFFFIWILNLFGLTPLGFNVTGQIAVTFCLALFTFLITQFSGTKDYWKHIFWMPGVHPVMKVILAPIEVLGMFTKPFALMVRLFANISAGHIVVMSLIAITFTLKASMGIVGSSLISIVLSFFITLIEVLVAFLQAYIFTMLSALFIGLAVEEHEH
ncbi:ATP synthase F0 subunit A [Aureicoccus marinus]|jgi:F-type H+-transporting ATPase subunit a|uniref:ATP synthase subunit a n=2 Tax=Aureicoccus marinus TaxID=754435 RepID=A0A2S7T9F9_9FLAO|nr:ATP synthase F0 subunit A [Aureicoccus marinus]